MRELILKALRVLVKQYPEIVDLLNTPADRLLIEDELLMWEGALLENKTAHIHHIPGGLADKVREMLNYAKTPEDIQMVFADVLAFFKQDNEKPRAWHEKFKPVINPGEVIDWDTVSPEITQDDIDEAVKRWDKLMPEYKGLLNAKFEGGE